MTSSCPQSPLPLGCTVAEPELAVAHAVPHAVVSQIRPDVAAFLGPDMVAVKTVHDAHCCVTAIATEAVDDDVFTFASELPLLTTLTGRNVRESPSLSVLACLPRRLRQFKWLHCENVGTYADSFSAALANLPELTTLDLSGSVDADGQLSTILADARTKLPKLRQLELRWSASIDRAALAEIAMLPCLEVLDVMYSSNVDAGGFEHLAQSAHRLRDLNLSYCPSLDSRVAACHLSAIRSLRTLTWIGSSVNALDFEQHLSKLDSLKVLTLEDCPRVDTRCLECVSMMTGLRELDLSLCDAVTAGGIEHIATLPRLRKLGLNQCANVDTECLRHLTNMPALEELHLSECQGVVAEGLKYLSRLPRLRELGLSECSGVDGRAIIDHVVAMPSLRILEVGSSIADSDAVRRCLPKSLRVVV